MPYYIMGTGSKQLVVHPNAKTIYENIRLFILQKKEQHPDLILISGLAEGLDEAIAKVGLREGIPYIAAVPNFSYGDYYWRRNSLLKRNRYETFKTLLNGAIQPVTYVCGKDIWRNGLHANFVRNQWMVDKCDEALVYEGNSPGTRDAVARLKAANKPYTKYPFSLQETLL